MSSAADWNGYATCKTYSNHFLWENRIPGMLDMLQTDNKGAVIFTLAAWHECTMKTQFEADVCRWFLCTRTKFKRVLSWKYLWMRLWWLYRPSGFLFFCAHYTFICCSKTLGGGGGLSGRKIQTFRVFSTVLKYIA